MPTPQIGDANQGPRRGAHPSCAAENNPVSERPPAGQARRVAAPPINVVGSTSSRMALTIGINIWIDQAEIRGRRRPKNTLEILSSEHLRSLPKEGVVLCI